MRRLAAKILGCGLVIAFLLAASVISFAQSDNTQISGFVKDQAGGAINGAKVTVKNEARAFERTATTNAEGYFVITQLPPGLYTIKFEANGFKQHQETGRKLDRRRRSSGRKLGVLSRAGIWGESSRYSSGNQIFWAKARDFGLNRVDSGRVTGRQIGRAKTRKVGRRNELRRVTGAISFRDKFAGMA
jgi:hypothetical protein